MKPYYITFVIVALVALAGCTTYIDINQQDDTTDTPDTSTEEETDSDNQEDTNEEQQDEEPGENQDTDPSQRCETDEDCEGEGGVCNVETGQCEDESSGSNEENQDTPDQNDDPAYDQDDSTDIENDGDTEEEQEQTSPQPEDEPSDDGSGNEDTQDSGMTDNDEPEGSEVGFSIQTPEYPTGHHCHIRAHREDDVIVLTPTTCGAYMILYQIVHPNGNIIYDGGVNGAQTDEIRPLERPDKGEYLVRRVQHIGASEPIYTEIVRYTRY